MFPWQCILLLLLCGVLISRIAAARKRKKKYLEKEFSRKLESVLQPRETVKLTCVSKGDRWVLTSRRLLLDTKEGFTAIPFAAMEKLQGLDGSGKKTESAKKMAKITFTAHKEFTVLNRGDDFQPFAKLLMAKYKQQLRKKQARKDKAKKK